VAALLTAWRSMPLLKYVRADDGLADHHVVMLEDLHPVDASGARQDQAA
jgi:hypothetical protein